jgi:hypothetical protein
MSDANQPDCSFIRSNASARFFKFKRVRELERHDAPLPTIKEEEL